MNRFLETREEEAFASLVKRHGPMVMGVCRRVLPDAHDASDAFQSVFLILAQKASSLKPQKSIASWLYRVAMNASLTAKASSDRRNKPLEPLEDNMETHQKDHGEATWADLRPVLDEELNRLPEKYRAPILLCHLDGLTYEEAAQTLELPHGIIRKRLEYARKLLKERFLRRGVTLSVGGLALLLEQNATASVSTAIVKSTVQSALYVAAGHTAIGSLLGFEVSTLMNTTMKIMLMQKIKVAVLGGLLVTGIGSGVTLLTYNVLSAGQDSKSSTQIPNPAPQINPDAKIAAAPKIASSNPLVDEQMAANAEVVLRVLLKLNRGGDKYAWYDVEVVNVLKNNSTEDFKPGTNLSVAALSWSDGVPHGVSTVYLERYNQTDKGLWKLVGGTPASGVSHSEFAAKLICINNIKNIGLACKQYAIDHDEKFPVHLKELCEGKYLNWVPSVMLCLGDPDYKEKLTKIEELNLEELSSYILVKGLTEANHPNVPLIVEKPGLHGAKGSHVFFVGGQCKFVLEEEMKEIWKFVEKQNKTGK